MNSESHISPGPQNFDPSLLIGEASIDREHGELFSQLNRLIEQPHAQPESEAFLDILIRLGEQISAHFHSEEQIIRSCGMPDHEVDQHIRAHTEILEQYFEMNFALMKGNTPHRSEFLLMVRRWIVEHLVLHDLKLTAYLPASN